MQISKMELSQPAITPVITNRSIKISGRNLPNVKMLPNN